MGRPVVTALLAVMCAAQTALAQQPLPPIEVVSPTPIPAARRPRVVATPRPVEEAATGPRPRIATRARGPRRVVATPAPALVAPVVAESAVVASGERVDTSKVPANVKVLSSEDIARTRSPSVTDALNTRIGAVNVNDVSGNAFQQDVLYRGFAASPVPGTPQGLAVYQQGVRINEAFGDVVNWDFIPTLAVDRTTVHSNNPVFGLNALGGALSIEMKSGFAFQGFEVDARGGSFGRRQVSAQAGQQAGDFAIYGAGDLIDENGFRDKGASRVRRFYGDLGYRAERTELHLNFTGAANKFGAAATTPVELLSRNYGAVYTTPQTTNNELAFVAANGRVDVTPTWTIQGVAYFRDFSQHHVDGNDSDVESCMSRRFLCLDDDVFPGASSSLRAIRDRTGAIIPNFLGGLRAGSIDRTRTQSRTAGGSLQTTVTERVFDRPNTFVFGASVDRGWTYFSGNSEIGAIGNDLTVIGSGVIYHANVAGGVNEVSLNSGNSYYGVYALDTLEVTSALAVTAGARLNIARIDLYDLRATALNGGATYSRVNPMAGATLKILPGVTAYAGYSEANRAPTPLELGCADPARPCLIDNFLTSDPPLKQVVARTVEAGFKGEFAAPPDFGGRIDWSVGAFRTLNTNDILSIPSFVTGRGYFANVGSTRRQGVEASVDWRTERSVFYLSYAMVDATFRNGLTLGSPNNPFADANGNVAVRPGDVIPGIPRHRVKAGFEVAVMPKWKVGADVIVVSSQFLRGDEGNQLAKIPGYATVNVRTSYDVTKNVQVYGLVNNLFNTRYANFGTLFDTGGVPAYRFSDPRSLSPGQPLAAYGGVKVAF